MQHTTLPYEIIIHDNDLFNEDNTEEVVEKFCYIYSVKNLTYMKGPNKGVMYGWNRCIEKAKYEWVYTPHVDMILLPHWDTNLAKGINKIGMAWKVLACSRSIERESHIQCQITNKDGYDFDWDTFKTKPGKEIFWEHVIPDVLEEYQKKDKGKTVTAPREPMCHHKMLWDKMNGYSEELFSFGTDDWKILKAWDCGVRRFPMILDSIVFHHSGKTNAKQNIDRDQSWPYEQLKKEFKNTHPNIGDIWQYQTKLLNYYHEIK